MKEPVFQGSCTALITPFSSSGINYVRLSRQLSYQAENGTAAIVIAGTTGENPTLSEDEFEQLTKFAVQNTPSTMKKIVCIGGNDTMHCLKRARFSEAAGADALLMTAPYYNKTTEAGLIAHFTAVADQSAIPLILYNVPGRTAISIPPAVFRALSAHPNINGVKEASGDVSLAGRILSECGTELNVWSGNDELTVPLMALGAKGVISTASNLLPQIISRLCDLCLQGDYSAAAAMNCAYEPLFRALFLEANPIPLKAAMAAAGLDSGILRLPLVTISDGSRAVLLDAMKQAAIPCHT